MKRRCVVTGMGVLSPIGCSFEAFADALRRGDCGSSELSEAFRDEQIDVQVGGEIKDLARHVPAELRQRGRYERLVLAAARQAVARSGLSSFEERPGDGLLLLATAIGPCDASEPTMQRHLIQRPFAALIDDLAFSGEAALLTNGCAAANYALTFAKDAIDQGRHDVALVGGVDSFALVCSAGYSRFGILAARSRPFDAGCEGIGVGEGAGFLMLEAEEHAVRRSATIHAEIAGGASAIDAYQPLSPNPNGLALLRSMRAALQNAGESATDIDYISAGAAGTQVGDQAEARAIKQLFAGLGRIPPVSATKSQTGNCHGASGILEAIACIAAIEQAFVPPTVNIDRPLAECTFDILAAGAREQPVSVALNNATGFGGADSAVVIRRFSQGDGQPR